MHKLLFLPILFLFACTASNKPPVVKDEKYAPDDTALYNTIVHLDSVYFNAYNHCDLATQAAMYSDSLEFYHDKTGLMTSKKDLLEALKNNICGKVTRTLEPGSIEVYPIHGYGAIEIGLHHFHNNQEKNAGPSRATKFIVIWENRNNTWQMKRIVSLH
jgi:ketosteroid isomerase-like protein